MTQDALSQTKTALRSVYRERRSVIPPVIRAAAARAVRDMLLREMMSLGVEDGSVVAGYWPVRDELDPREALRALAERGFRIALPRVVAKGLPLEFRLWREGDELDPDRMGIASPPIASETLDPDLILVPLLAFDALGRRLGYGGGYYDRTLTALRARKPILAIGLAYEHQETPEVPAGPVDARLDGVVTERRVLWLNRCNLTGTGR